MPAEPTPAEQIRAFAASLREYADAFDKVADKPNPSCENCVGHQIIMLEAMVETCEANLARAATFLISKRIKRRRNAEMN